MSRSLNFATSSGNRYEFDLQDMSHGSAQDQWEGEGTGTLYMLDSDGNRRDEGCEFHQEQWMAGNASGGEGPDIEDYLTSWGVNTLDEEGEISETCWEFISEHIDMWVERMYWSKQAVLGRTEMTCEQHAVCASSDSALPECECWCAECTEHMKKVRSNWTPDIRVIGGNA